MTTVQQNPTSITDNKNTITQPVNFRKTEKTLYSQVLQRVTAEGLLEKRPSFYIKRLVVITAFSLTVWAGVAWTAVMLSQGNLWLASLALPLMILQGILAAQYGFIAHEAAHKQVFASPKLNEIFGIGLANGLAGLSYGFWLKKHNRHHAKPNQIGADPDINIRVLAFRTEQVEAKKNPERFLTRNQGKLFPILLMFTGFDLLLDSFVSVTRKDRHLGRRIVEFSLMVIRQVTPVIILLLLFPPLIAGVLWLVSMMAFGMFMGGAFAPNHKGMPLVAKDSKIDFFTRQVLTSRNIKSSWLKDNLMGGLNFQVEHHLFPSMPRVHLRRAHEIVVQFCEENNVPFVETGLFESYGIIIRHLDKVGLSNNVDPFVCPMVAELRPRN